MKHQEIMYKKPVKIIQLFRKINVYGKNEKSFEARKEQLKWSAPLSKSGYVKEGKAFVPEKILNFPNNNQCSLIILLDDLSNSEKEIATEQNQYFLPVPMMRFEIFALKRNMEIFLNYNEYDIGIPHRENFKLGTLKERHPLEIKINGKFDFTMTEGKQRAFKEQQYIFYYLGEFYCISILKEPVTPVKKEIPENTKMVDLIKTMW